MTDLNSTPNNANNNAKGATVAAADKLDATIEQTAERVEEVVRPGIFGRIARKMRDNPIPTSVGLSVGTMGTVYGVSNYRRFGTPLPGFISASDLNDVGEAVAAAFSAAR